MRSVGIKALKNKLSAYVRLVAAGETVLVTHGDKVVAELSPPREDRSDNVSDVLLTDAIRKGYITPHVLHRRGIPPRIPVARWQVLQSELDHDRADR